MLDISRDNRANITIQCEVDIDFALQFHLPYVAWRPSTTPRKDKRVGRDRKPLRNTTDVTFLTTSTERCADPKQRAYLYDAQISCLVAGEDHWRWEGYGLVDTYFEEDGVRKDMKYYESQDAPQYISPDPIPGGNHDFSKSLPPREYWLMALEKRLKQVVEEWQNVYQRIEQGVDEFVCRCDELEGILPLRAETSVGLGLRPTQQRFSKCHYLGVCSVVCNRHEWVMANMLAFRTLDQRRTTFTQRRKTTAAQGAQQTTTKRMDEQDRTASATVDSYAAKVRLQVEALRGGREGIF